MTDSNRGTSKWWRDRIFWIAILGVGIMGVQLFIANQTLKDSAHLQAAAITFSLIQAGIEECDEVDKGWSAGEAKEARKDMIVALGERDFIAMNNHYQTFLDVICLSARDGFPNSVEDYFPGDLGLPDA